jgi:PAS domain S-box-containing protein
MQKIFCCLLASTRPEDRVLVEEELGRKMPHLQITQVVDAPGWEQALAAGDFDLVIIAEQLPGADSATLIKTLKSRRPKCPVIMLADPEREKAAWKAMLSGLDDYFLRSPEHLPRLFSVVQAARYRARHNLARHQVEEALRTSEAGYREIFDTIDKVIFIHDPETGCILDANQVACDRLGYTREEFKNLNLGALSLGEPLFSQLGVQKRLKNTIQEGPQSFEWLIRDKAGKPFWAEITMRPALIGGQERVLSFAHDISSLKRIQEALSESEQRYEAFLDSAADAIFIHDTAGRLLQVNDAACKLLGYTRKELQQMTLKDIDAPSHATIQKRIRESHHQGRVFVETALRRRDGTAVPVELSSRFVEYSGVPVAFSIARDITERKEAEEKLRQSETLYRSIFETTGTATCIDDENAILRLVNDECTRLTGYSREELEGKKSWTEFIVPEDLERLKGYHRLRRFDPEGPPRSYTLRWQDRQGQIRDMLATINLIPGTKNSVASLLDITDRQQAEKALRESEVRYRLLVETMNDGLGMQDENGWITFVNRRLCEILGYPKEELIGRPLSDFLDIANQKIMDAQRQLRKQGGSRAYDIDWIRKDGKTVSTSISPVPLFDAGGFYKGSFAVISDITARQLAEKALRESEEKYRTIFENTGTATAIVEEDTTISLANAEFAKLTGFSREELEKEKSWTEFFAAEDLPRMKEYHRLRRVDPKSAPRNYETRFVDRYGMVKDLLMTVAAIPGTRKSLGSLLDITARKNAEQAVKQSEQHFRLLIQNSMSHLRILGPDATILYESPTLEKFLGYRPDDQVGFNAFDFVHPDDLDAAREHWAKLLENPGLTWCHELRYRHKDGTWRHLEIKGKNLLQEPIIKGIVLNAQDITPRKEALEALRRAEAEKSIILKNMTDRVLYYDRDFRILWANQVMADYLGLAPEEMVGRFCYELIHRRPDLCPDCPVIKATEADRPVETEILKPNGRIFSYKTSPVKDEHGEVQGFVTVVSDITARKKAEEAIKASEEKMRLVIESSPVGIRITQQGRHIYVNPALVKMFGYADAGELVGRPVDLLFAPEDREIYRDVREAGPAGQPAPWSYEARGLKKDGSRLEAQVWQTEIDYQGEPARLDFILDLSEAKSLRSQLLQAQKVNAF